MGAAKFGRPQITRVLREIPGILPIWPKIWLILGPNQPQTRLRAKNLTISTQFSRENREEKRGCCREERKGKQPGCERKTWYSLTLPPLARFAKSCEGGDVSVLDPALALGLRFSFFLFAVI